MELVYLWVEEYKNIKNQGFNFSPRFECEFFPEYEEYKEYEENGEKKKRLKDNCELKIKEKEYISIFPKNINITAIVGENGSGKSSIEEALYLLQSIKNKKIFYVYTLDYKEFQYQTNFDFTITPNSFTLKKDEIKISYLGLSFIPNITQRILTAKSNEDRPSYTNNYKMEFLFKFIDVYKKDNQVLKKINEKFVFDKLKINIYRDELILKKELKIQQGLAFSNLNLPYEEYESFLSNTYTKIYELIKNAINPSGEDSLTKRIIFSSGDLILDIKISFIIQYMNNLVSLFSNIENINHKKFTSVQDIFNDLSFENLFEKIKEFEEKINFHQTHLTNIEKNIELLKDWIQICEKHKDLFIKDSENYSLTVSLDNSLVSKILNFKDLFTTNSDFNSFSLLSVDLLSYENGINFFGLSSGEQKRLSLYIEIIDSYFFSNSKILILDEPDTFLHPQWNKKFINDLLKSLPTENKKHLIISSHSPFILSDLPKENVIFLEKYKENDSEVKNGNQKIGNCKNVTKETNIDTFGANIHTLLSHGFFMEDGLMGEFAKSKITEILDFLNDKEELKTIKKEQIKPIIEFIGEDFLRNKLLNLYRNKFIKDEREKEKQILKNKIDELQKQYDELNK